MSCPQVQASGDLVEKLDQADRLAEQQKASEARALYEAVAAGARADHDAKTESRALAGIGQLLGDSSKYTEAQQYLERAVALAESAGAQSVVARAANALGIIAGEIGQAEQARIWYRKSVDAATTSGDLRSGAASLINMATLKTTSSSESLTLIRKAHEIAVQLGDRKLQARALHNWGDILFTSGDYAAAMEKLESAAEVYERAADTDALARVFTSMGRLNRMHGRPEAAIPLYEKALALQRASGDKVGVIQSLNATAVAYGTLDQFQRARQFYEKAYALALETDSPRVIDFMRANLAGGLLDLGEYARAAGLLEEVLRSGSESYPAIRHTQLARAYLGMGRLAKARTQADKAVELAAGQPTQLPNALHRRAMVRERQGDLRGAMDDALEAIRVIEGTRSKLVPLDFMKQGFSAYYQLNYSSLIGLYARQGMAEKALETAETARARAFLDLLAARDVRPETLTSSALHPQTTTDMAATARRLHSTTLSYWTAEDAVFIGVIPPEGKLALRRVDIPLRRLRALTGSAIALPTSTSRAAPASRGPSRSAGISWEANSWRELYRILVDPVRTLLPPPGARLTIIPHGPLMRLSFAALTDGNGRYLLEDYALHYVPAGALLQFTALKSPADANMRRFLFVADPILPPRTRGESPMPRLPGARAEVRSIMRLLAPETATILQGSQADEQTVGSSMDQASVLHFATHGVMLDDQPLDSYLALGRPAGTDGNGRLTAQEIYGFNLHADLVVLSSCRSGGGKVTGEGISALTRAFFYAGAPSILASLWDVPDQPANRLLPGFYASWLGGRSRVDALRAAQLGLLADLRAGRVKVRTPAGDFALAEHPALWAGFILLGEP